jgi:hypothetical protein
MLVTINGQTCDIDHTDPVDVVLRTRKDGGTDKIEVYFFAGFFALITSENGDSSLHPVHSDGWGHLRLTAISDDEVIDLDHLGL